MVPVLKNVFNMPKKVESSLNAVQYISNGILDIFDCHLGHMSDSFVCKISTL